MNEILSKPVKSFLTPIPRTTVPEVSTPPLQSIPRSVPQKPMQSLQEPLNEVSGAQPYPALERSSRTPPVAAEGVPALQPVARPGALPGVPALEVKPRKVVVLGVGSDARLGPAAVEQLANAGVEIVEVAASSPALQADGYPVLIPIGDASNPATVGVPIDFVPPLLEVIRTGIPPLSEIPSLVVKPRDIHTYVITGINEDEGTYDLHGCYLPDELNVLPGGTLPEKLLALCTSKFNSMDDARRVTGNRTIRQVTPQNGNAMNLVALLEIVDNDQWSTDGRDSADERTGQPYVCYTFKVVKFKMNSLGVMLKLNTLP